MFINKHILSWHLLSTKLYGGLCRYRKKSEWPLQVPQLGRGGTWPVLSALTDCPMAHVLPIGKGQQNSTLFCHFPGIHPVPILF